MKDLASIKKKANFALSRRQHGFESRWGHQIKLALTRSNTSHPCVRSQPQHELRERAGSETAAAALDVVVPIAPSTQQLRSRPQSLARQNGSCSTRTRPTWAHWAHRDPFHGPPNADSTWVSLRGSKAKPNGCTQLAKGDSRTGRK
jgi:hypothetical protein